MDLAELGVERRDRNGGALGGRGGAHLLHFMTEQIGFAERRLYRPQNLQDAGVQFLDRRLLVPDRRLLALYRAVAVVRIRGTQMKAFTDLERLAEIGGGADVLQVRVEFLAAGGDLVDQDFPQLCSVA